MKKMKAISPSSLLRRSSFSAVSPLEQLESRRMMSVSPTIGAFDAPTGSVAPGTHLTITFEDVISNTDITAVTIFRDSNENGFFDQGDEIFGQATEDPNDNSRWVYSEILQDGVAVGDVTFFAVPTDANNDEGLPTEFGVAFDYRIFYPEGWRNDTTINEYIPMVNPNNFDVEYRVIARYETGDRDAVIAEGIIPANSRGGITISEFANPGQAAVRLNEGYALEILSSDYIGATLSHYDSFTGNPGTGAAVGESFTNQTSHEWFFADVSNISADFILFYNPQDQPLDLTVTFYDENMNAHTIPWSVDNLRRSGIALSNAGLNLPANNRFGVYITSANNQEFVASVSSYSTVSEVGYTSLGQRLGVTVFPLVEFRESTDNDLKLYNPSNSNIDITVRYMYNGANPSSSQVTYSVPARQHMDIDLDDLAPNGAESVTLRVTGGYVQVVSVDETRGDSLQATPASTAYTKWAFGDGFLDRNTAGTVGFETLAIYNPNVAAQDIQVRFHFTDGTFADRTISVGAQSGGSLRLDQENLILDHAQLNFYSISVTANVPVVASMIHWDLFQGGGWASLGTPGGNDGAA